MINTAEEFGGAVLIYSPEDAVAWANAAQARMFPCTDYQKETYASLFWSVLNSGAMISAEINRDPVSYLARKTIERRAKEHLQWVGAYQHGRMAVSNLCLSDGTCVQVRVGLPCLAVEQYLPMADGGADLFEIARLRRALVGLNSALDALDLAVALCRDDAALIHGNASFTEALTAGDGLCLDEAGHVTSVMSGTGPELRAAIATVASSRAPRMVFLRRHRGDPLLMAVAPGELERTVILVVARFGDDAESVAASLRAAFGLPDAQAHVAALIGAGLSPEAIGALRGSSPRTVYNQINGKDGMKARLRQKEFAADDLSAISKLVGKIAAMSRAITRKS
ncbi:helix-turn-helix transcriptional regulator [Azospirillum aestuarii]|uniref:helix-turn-helix transcriptional regulator n=1 Tax=Azospirillum aestuarii TaxID=2802052 RepID=UPI004054C6B4